MWALSRLSFPHCQTFLSAHRPPFQTHSLSEETATHPPLIGSQGPPRAPHSARPGVKGKNSRVRCTESQDSALPKRVLKYTTLLTTPQHRPPPPRRRMSALRERRGW